MSTAKLATHHECGGQHHDADDHRQVLLGDGLDGQLAEAGQAEYVLCYDGPAEQHPDVDAELGHHRDEGGPQRVLVGDPPLADPLARAVRM